MITQRRLERLQTAVIESRARILQQNPVYGLLLMHLRFVLTRSFKTASINAYCIFFHADFLDKIIGKELDFVLCHLLSHVMRGDIWRGEELKGDDYHFACDIVNNANLQVEGLAENRYAHVGKVHTRFGLRGESGYGRTPRDVYEQNYFSIESMPELDRRSFLFDNDAKWNTLDTGEKDELLLDADNFYEPDRVKGSTLSDSGKGVGMDGEIEIGVENGKAQGKEQEEGEADGDEAKSIQTGNPQSDDGKESSRFRLKDKWQQRMCDAKQALDDAGEEQWAGSEKGGFLRKLDALRQSQLDWKKILNEFVTEEIADYSFQPPDRRYSDLDFFLPDYNEKDFSLIDVLFMVDTSGSVRDSDIALAYSEIKGALEQFSGKIRGQLGFFDTVVQKIVPFFSVNDILREIPVGGGGTDFYELFNFINYTYADTKPSSIVIFTDGYGAFPSESEANGIPVLWLLNNNRIDPPWGKVARLVADSDPFDLDDLIF